MIIDALRNEWLYISTPKCASKTLYEILKKIGGAKIGIGHHPRTRDRLAKIHFTVVRNPYDRAVSIWKFSESNLTFDDFAKSLAKNTNPTRNRVLHLSQKEWLKDVKLDRVVKLENLGEGLKLVTGYDGEIPKLNSTDHKPYTEYLTEKSVYNINIWAEKDFQFGYEKFD